MSWPADGATVTIKLDDDGNFAVTPLKCWITADGTISFMTDGKIGARVVIPDASLVWENAKSQGNEGEVVVLEFRVGDVGPQTCRVVSNESESAPEFPVELPYSVFRVEQNKIQEGLKRAPVIIIVKTAANR